MTTKSLSEMVEKLIESLSTEAVVFEKFLKLLSQQQEMLVNNDIDGLNSVTGLQREKVAQSQLLNQRRDKLVAEIKSANTIEGDLNVSMLLEHVDEHQGGRLIQLREIIQSLTQKIGEVRNQNAMLLNRSKEYILRTMELLSKINNPDSGYAANGETVENSSSVAVDRRA